MSVQNEIDRLNGAKISIKENLVAKGVEVPSNARIDDMANLIANIASGDGVSPIVDIEEIENGYMISITDVNGEHNYTVVNNNAEVEAWTLLDTQTLETSALDIDYNNTIAKGARVKIKIPSGTSTLPSRVIKFTAYFSDNRSLTIEIPNVNPTSNPITIWCTIKPYYDIWNVETYPLAKRTATTSSEVIGDLSMLKDDVITAIKMSTSNTQNFFPVNTIVEYWGLV